MVLSTSEGVGLSSLAVSDGSRTGRMTITTSRNGSFSVNRLPSELLQLIVCCLSPRDRLRTVSVCRAWRTTLLNSPLIWSHVRLLLRAQHDQLWAPSLATLLRRSKAAPLDVELCFQQFAPQRPDHLTEWTEAFNAIGTLLMLSMFRMRSLEVAVSFVRGTTWETMLAMPAPLLERFTLVCIDPVASSGSATHLPRDLFSAAAPRLRELSLAWAHLPHQPCPALQRVTHFTEQTPVVAGDPEANANLATVLPALSHLTLTGHYNPRVTVNSGLPVTVRMRATAWPQNRHFEDIACASICLDANAPDWITETPGIIAEFMSTKSNTKSIDVKYCSMPAPSVWEGFAPKSYQLRHRTLAVSIDDNIVVTLPWHDFETAIAQFNVRDLRDISVPISLWPVLQQSNLPPLQNLTLFLPPGDSRDHLHYPVNSAFTDGCLPVVVSTMHLARVERSLGSPFLRSAEVVEFMRTTCALPLPKLVLHGFELRDEPEIRDVEVLSMPPRQWRHEVQPLSWSILSDGHGALCV
ncbi:hypothetical protein AURDEDRAFT_187881 [Auricularia subglabra TFB-10046 SS5]|uniref:F-box domain-containing protein n=1 Tax=Auricularia subglabra (strain TFB-10046 / SS5) TaxID=717982 RepID=J0WVA9_AURST|nr:hypothetical protein AURDEDRAFT_187881 [Auricularia subglabra TFB-10046 SS5]